MRQDHSRLDRVMNVVGGALLGLLLCIPAYFMWVGLSR